MATKNKRMFSRDVTESGKFLEMPDGPQILYFHLGMNADDDGFVEPRKIMRMIGAADDNIKLLITKGFVIPFDTGVTVITHWNENNYVRGDRYFPTKFVDEKSKLTLNDNIYSLGIPTGIPDGNQAGTQIRLDKVKQDKVREERGDESPTPKKKASEFFEQVAKLTRKEEAPEMQAFLVSLHEKTGAPKEVLWNTVKDFCGYWTEKNGTGTRERWQMQNTFEVVKRLHTWFKREKFDRFRGGAISKPKGKIVSA